MPHDDWKVHHPLTLRYLAGPFTTNRADRRRAQATLRAKGVMGQPTETRDRRARQARDRQAGRLRTSPFGGRHA